MQEMLYPTSYLKSKGLGKACALLTDGRFSGGTSGLDRACLAGSGGRRCDRAGARWRPHPHRHPGAGDRAAGRGGGAPTAVPGRTPSAGDRPSRAPRKVSTALKVYALLATSADKGAVRDTELLEAAWSARGPAPAGDVV